MTTPANPQVAVVDRIALGQVVALLRCGPSTSPEDDDRLMATAADYLFELVGS